jgi:hypothetical protein
MGLGAVRLPAALQHVNVAGGGVLAMRAACVGLAVSLLVACSSQKNQDSSAGDGGHSGREGGVPSVTGLDGTWDITFTNSHWYSGGSLYVNPTSAEANMVSVEESTPQGANCTYVVSRDVIDLSLSAMLIQGTTVHLQQLEGLGCPLKETPGTVVVRHPLPGMEAATRAQALPSQFGTLGGTWNVTTPLGGCRVTFSDAVMSGSCDDGTTFTATLNAPSGDTLSGTVTQGQNVVEFAAHRH